MEELKTGEIEKRNNIQKDITGVYADFITYDPKP